MSFRELTKIEIREVLRRWQARQSVRQIGREGGVDWKDGRAIRRSGPKSGRFSKRNDRASRSGWLAIERFAS